MSEAGESTTSAEFFEAKYRERADPWDFARSEYERARYEAIVGALGERRFARAFEPGCSVGELTWRLAERCEHVDAMDISTTATARARERCKEFANVSVQVGSLPHHIPRELFDLIAFCEIGYYFDEEALRMLVVTLVGRMDSGGTFLAAHWLGSSKDHILSGDRVHEIVGAASGLELEQSERHAEFRLDRWVRA